MWASQPPETPRPACVTRRRQRRHADDTPGAPCIRRTRRVRHFQVARSACAVRRARDAGDAKMFRHRARPHPEQDHVAARHRGDLNRAQQPRRRLPQQLIVLRLRPVGTIGRHQLGFSPKRFAPQATHQPQTITTRTATGRLMHVRRADPAPRPRRPERSFPHVREPPSFTAPARGQASIQSSPGTCGKP
jgi:hypothetical protein